MRKGQIHLQTKTNTTCRRTTKHRHLKQNQPAYENKKKILCTIHVQTKENQHAYEKPINPQTNKKQAAKKTRDTKRMLHTREQKKGK